ncbi:hypothetical protein KUTeg_012465 [Tegillarca granosa]|uniref:DUF885 domain-containing protein n=1 Tax=Tegillarca granosa TaxID=220873 RepID=A0ABQ9F358_TEGGR|nr:hypothetical protein KUTeg_012465 [Tegillarca granosa]
MEVNLLLNQRPNIGHIKYNIISVIETLCNRNEILSEYKDVVYRRIYPSLPKIFNKIPVNQCSTTALRWCPGLKFTFMALSLHEAVPGHHLQISIQNEAKIPKYRRYLEIRNYFLPPFHFPFYTAYVEGWGLYAEYLGEELGLYKDDYEMIGRYSFEMTRACRLVVDTGIHYFNWTRDKAIDYMMDYTILSRELISKDVDRYITWPGQACAYKIGELKIKEMRQKAKIKLDDVTYF